ncbi:Mpv17 / PMP22 family protein [Trichuris suis]|nr:Mpv17 / PMP22 family protein [Trichuris suis]
MQALRNIGALKAKCTEMYAWYNRKLLLHPWKGQMVVAGFMMISGDLISQIAVERRRSLNEIEVERAARFLFIGTFYVGPSLWAWFTFLERRFPGTTIGVAVKRMMLDQLVFAPVSYLGFLALIGFLKSMDSDGVREKVENEFWPVYLANLKVWPAVQLFNFYIIPHYTMTLLLIPATYITAMHDEATSFCFDRSKFTHSAFNAHQLLRGAMELGFSLERIRDDLRVYLKIIQNSMIEMINQDYAHFVLLSSNIVNLRSPVDKLVQSVEKAANEIDQSDTRLKASELTEKLEEQRRLSSNAQQLQSKLITMQLLQRIKNLLQSPNPDNFVLSALARHILKAKVVVELSDEKSNRDTLNRCLAQIGEYLQAEFGPSFLVSIRNEDHNHCLLMALVGFTERHLKSSFVPTDPSNFRDTYRAFSNFAAELVRRCGSVEASTSKLLKLTRSKFDVQVYHQLCCLETLSSLEEIMKPSVPLEPSTGSAYHFKLHDLLCNTLERIWCEEQSINGLFLLPLAWSCLILTFRLLNVYEKFVGEYHRNCESLLDELDFAANKPSKQNVEDVVHFIKDGFRFVDFLSKIYDRLLLPKWSSDFSTSRVHEVVKSSLSSIELVISGLVSSLLTDWLSSRLIRYWAAVSDLPRLFRWTRKESPSTPSSYMMDGCNLLVKIHQLLSDASVPNDLLRDMFRRTLDTATSIYATNVSQVLSSVDQISSSLSKLKRGTKATAADVLSDDGKIKLQLQLDLFKVKTVLDSLPLPDDCDAYSTLSRLTKEVGGLLQ